MIPPELNPAGCYDVPLEVPLCLVLHALEEPPGKLSGCELESWYEKERVQGFSMEPHIEAGENQNIALRKSIQSIFCTACGKIPGEKGGDRVVSN